MEKILVTPRSLTKKRHPAFSLFEDAGLSVVTCTPGVMPGEDELLSLLPGCIGYLAGVEKITARLLEAAPGLQVISRNGAGMENVDIEAAKRLGIKVFPTAGANARGVAELTTGLMIGLLRSIPFSSGALKAERWERREGMELEGKCLGIIGCGEVGRLVAGMAGALGMRVLGYDLYPNMAFCLDSFEWADTEQIFRQADIITLHVPGGEKPLIDREALKAMKEGVYIINTARASVVDEEA
ncbi:MAG: oxidoreductase, partial [Spirochaetales bacterium]